MYCSYETQVINSRHQKRANTVWRRRKCQNCQSVFTTHELPDYGALWRVSNNKSALMPFSRDKLLISVHKSLQHRPAALSDASALVDTIIIKLATVADDALLKRRDIITVTSRTLELFDSVAAVHYKAFHK